MVIAVLFLAVGCVAATQLPGIKTVTLSTVTVHLVPEGDPTLTPPVAGMANTDNEIWVRVFVQGGKIIIKKGWVLGHELTHLLSWTDSEIQNPDTEAF